MNQQEHPACSPAVSVGPGQEKTPFLTRLVDMFLRGDVAILFTLVAAALGLAALYITPREEEPQIVVPLADVLISAPGLSAEEIEQQITTRLEKLLYQIDGVEYVYSMTRPGQAVVTVRFYVGEDREDSLVKLYNKIQSNVDQVPPGVAGWVVKPIEIDDVPIVVVTLWTDRPELYSDYELRRIAEELENQLQAIPDTNRVWVQGGRARKIRVELDPQALASRRTSALQVVQALQASNVHVQAGRFEQQDRQVIIEAGLYVRDALELQELVVNVHQDRPVYLKDVARVIDGPEEPETYSWIGFGPAAQNPLDPLDRPSEPSAKPHPPAHARERASTEGDAQEHRPPIADSSANPAAGQASAESPGFVGATYPAVHIAVAKRRGANAVWVSRAVEARMAQLASTHLPDGVYYRISRDYGETSNEKVNELVESLIVAVFTVVGLIGIIIGWRAAGVVALAIPICYGITLFINYLAGYTINRVTLFALILALGLLVDDPITDVENIARYFAMRRFRPREAVLRAVQEVRPALVMSVLAIVASFLPLSFITGMMGPYMAPMALNVPVALLVSMVISFMVTPWMAMTVLQRSVHHEEPAYDVRQLPIYRLSRAVLGPILDRSWLAGLVLLAVVGLFAGSLLLPAFRVVPLKMLPYDNKNEFQIVIDMPEGTTLERTASVAHRLGEFLSTVNEVKDFQAYVGMASPMDFNGMVRHYFLRRAAHVADIRVNLAHKKRRSQQSHTILLRLRDRLTEIAQQDGANIKLVEVPPGPPVLSTITAEVYGPPEADYEQLAAVARLVEDRLRREPGVVDVDSTAEDDVEKWIFVTDKAKAALSGITTEQISRTLQLALSGLPATVLHLPKEVHPLWIELRLPRSIRSAIDDLRELYVQGSGGYMVQLGALGEFRNTDAAGRRLVEEKTIYHKNLRRVAFVYAEIAGRPPADAIVDIQMDQLPAGTALAADAPAEPRPVEQRSWFRPGGGLPWTVPAGFQVVWHGEGEWKITLDVFRDLGLAFVAALLAIYVLLMFETGSRMLPLVIMLAIPLTTIGIMPGFWLLNVVANRPVGGYPDPVFFTATAMIGMIALAGIVVRNSVVLIDFIHHGQEYGLDLREAVIQSVAVRTRPILATAGTTLLGNWVITLDPIFSGLAWSIIFGLFASTLFTLLVVPVVYWLLYRRSKPGGAPTA